LSLAHQALRITPCVCSRRPMRGLAEGNTPAYCFMLQPA
jgi:hypothetical protein